MRPSALISVLTLLLLVDGRWSNEVAQAHLLPRRGLLPDRLVRAHYNRAVMDAALPEPEENIDGLTAIAPDNSNLIWNEDDGNLLVVTWKSQLAYEQFIQPYTQTSSNEAHVIWVTAAPEIQEFCQQYMADHPDATAAELDLRLKQHLGLHYTWNYDVFVELWVSPDHLFRPCVDPEITDTRCNLEFGDRPPIVHNIANYHQFYTNLYFHSFRGIPGVPWTGLGYTYDWGNPVSSVGVSEFILTPNTPYKIKSAYSTFSYCQADQ